MNIFLTGAPTLKRFTNGILRDGIERCGYKVCSAPSECKYGIIQIHGSCAARQDDLAIIRDITELVRHLAGTVILLHRPDEIRDSIPQLKTLLSSLPPTVGIVMLGDMLIDDPFYQVANLERRAIPHGFFHLNSITPLHPVILGSHTSWGEMRSVQGVVALLKAVSDIGLVDPIVGYLGGIPEEVLSHKSLSHILEEEGVNEIFTLRELDKINWQEQLASSDKHTIFVNPGDAPFKFDVTFNVQLYHYGKRVRLGESSGSLHASGGIPVIFEMNGSERIESLKTIKVPYADSSDVGSADFRSAAQEIATLVRSGEYRNWLEHNREMATVWDSQAVGSLYISFLEVLAKKCKGEGTHIA
jgi:hypothetical protein